MTKAGERLINAAQSALDEFRREGGKPLEQMEAEMTDTPNKIKEIRAALKPCPFCGGEMKWSVAGDYALHVGYSEDCPIHNQGFTNAEAWNTRALAPDMARIVLAAEELAAVFEDRLVIYEAGSEDEEAWRILSEYRVAVEGGE